MSIGRAVQRGTLIYIYDQDDRAITSISVPGRWPGDGLKAYTPDNISVQKGPLVYRYNQFGKQTGIMRAAG